MPAPLPGILDIEPYVGGESRAPNATRVIRLASNEGAFGPPAKAITAYRSLAGEIHRYPDGGATRLREALASRWAIDAGMIVCGAGSDELITLLVRAYVAPGDNIVHARHAFLMYGLNARAAGARAVVAPSRDLGHDVDSLIEATNEQTRIVFVANPNNPTGTVLSARELTALRQRLREDILLVIDAAYAEYIDDHAYTAGHDLVERSDNVVMLRTFSKIYGLGGMRLGWAYCPGAIVDVLNRIRSPFNVSASAQAAGVGALEDSAHFDESFANNTKLLPTFIEKLNALGLNTPPSYGNFALPHFDPDRGQHAEDARLHLKRQGILVRQVGAYELPDRLRITIGTEEEMDIVAAELEAWLDGLVAT